MWQYTAEWLKKYRAWRLYVVNNIEQSSLKEKLVEIINLTVLRSRQVIY